MSATATATRPKGKSKWLRTAPARGLQDKQGVDRNKNIIYGASIATKGEAEGHGFELDDETLDMLVEVGNAAAQGVKARFTHPSISADGLGKFLGRWKEFRRDGDQTRADLHISPRAFNTPHGNLGSYVMGLAEDDPDAFGVSIAYLIEDVKERDGDQLAVLRPSILRAADVVDDPAANDGLLSMGLDTPDRQAAALLDTVFGRDSPEVIRERVTDFLDKYLATKQGAKTVGESKETPIQLSQKELDTKLAAAKAEGAAEVTKELSGLKEEMTALSAELDDKLAAAKAEGAAAAAKELSGVKDETLAAVGDIEALYQQANLSEKAQKKHPRGDLLKLSVRDAQDRLFAAVCEDRPPVGDGDAGQLEKDDPDAKFKAEFKAGGGEAELGVTEEQFVRTGRIDAGLDKLET